MPDDVLKLTRNELAQFLPSQRAIRAFENLLNQIQTLTPAALIEILGVLGSNQNPELNGIRLALQDLVDSVPHRQVNLDPILKRLEELEAKQGQKTNTRLLEERVATLESILGV